MTNVYGFEIQKLEKVCVWLPVRREHPPLFFPLFIGVSRDFVFPFGSLSAKVNLNDVL